MAVGLAERAFIWAKPTRYGRRVIVAGSLLLTGAIWLAQQQMMSQFYRSGKACVKRFIRRRLTRATTKKTTVSGGTQRPQGTLSAPVSREQASGDLLAEIAISMIWRSVGMVIRCMPQLKTQQHCCFRPRTKENPAYLYSAIAKEKSVKHCGGCKDQGVRRWH